MSALNLLRLAALSCTLALAPAAQATNQTRPVQFAKGASSATVKGAVRGDRYIDYTLRAAAGQTMKVDMDSRVAYFNVLPPGSKDLAIYNSSVNGNSWSGTLEQAGAYTVRVYLMRNEARRGVEAPYTLTVGITGAAGHGDAKVAGTKFNATGSVPCALGTDAKMCPYGVIRSGPGQAEVRITPPGGMERVLKFNGSQATAPGSQSIKARKQGDEWNIEVNDFERYTVPEAVINGG